MKNGVASKNKNMCLKINIFILTVFINQECKVKIYQTIATNNIVIENTNQIKLNTYPDFLKENNLNLKGYY